LGRRIWTCIGIPGHALKHRTQEELLHGTLMQLKRQSWFMNSTCVILKQQHPLPAARIASVPMATRTLRPLPGECRKGPKKGWKRGGGAEKKQEVSGPPKSSFLLTGILFFVWVHRTAGKSGVQFEEAASHVM
jgi:hypothetical protein